MNHLLHCVIYMLPPLDLHFRLTACVKRGKRRERRRRSISIIPPHPGYLASHQLPLSPCFLLDHFFISPVFSAHCLPVVPSLCCLPPALGKSCFSNGMYTQWPQRGWDNNAAALLRKIYGSEGFLLLLCVNKHAEQAWCIRGDLHCCGASEASFLQNQEHTASCWSYMLWQLHIPSI